jgi:hypothetical protein
MNDMPTYTTKWIRAGSPTKAKPLASDSVLRQMNGCNDTPFTVASEVLVFEALGLCGE